jgi:hypothetical protein
MLHAIKSYRKWRYSSTMQVVNFMPLWFTPGLQQPLVNVLETGWVTEPYQESNHSQSCPFAYLIKHLVKKTWGKWMMEGCQLHARAAFRRGKVAGTPLGKRLNELWGKNKCLDLENIILAV